MNHNEALKFNREILAKVMHLPNSWYAIATAKIARKNILNILTQQRSNYTSWPLVKENYHG